MQERLKIFKFKNSFMFIKQVFDKILKIDQLAGNKNFSSKSFGSSETTCNAVSFNFSEYNNWQPEHKKNLDLSFLIWFIGFCEGDGSWVVAQEKKTQKTRNFFFISQKDPKILYFIRTNLGFGLVQNHGDYFRFYVSDQKNIDRLIRIFNGNLVLKKSDDHFKKWFAAYKNYNKINNFVDYKKFEIDKRKFNLDNSWFSGFIDAEGCFNACIKNEIHLKKRFTLTQKNANHFFKEFKLFFPSYSHTIYKKEKMYEQVQISSYTSLLILIDYLDKFPLKSNKIISYKRWKRVFFYLKFKESLNFHTLKSKKKLQRLIKVINSKKL